MEKGKWPITAKLHFGSILAATLHYFTCNSPHYAKIYPKKHRVIVILGEDEKKEEQSITVNPMVLYTFSAQAKQLMHVEIFVEPCECSRYGAHRCFTPFCGRQRGSS